MKRLAQYSLSHVSAVPGVHAPAYLHGLFLLKHLYQLLVRSGMHVDQRCVSGGRVGMFFDGFLPGETPFGDVSLMNIGHVLHGFCCRLQSLS